MPYKRGNIYYMKRSLPGIGVVRRSLETGSKTRADELERAAIELHKRGHIAPVQAFADGEVSAHRLAEAVAAGKVGELEAELRRGPRPQLSDAIADALAHANKNEDRYRISFDHLLAFHGADMPIDEALTDDAVVAFDRARREAGAAKQTVNNDLQAVSMLATRAVDRGWIAERPKIERYPYEPRIRFMSPEQARAYLAALPEQYRTLAELLMRSGLRLGEALSLTAADIQAGMVHVRTGKTTAAVRSVPVPDWLFDKVSSNSESLKVARRTFQKAHNAACGDVGLEDFHVHDLRHHYGVTMARAGVPLGVLSRLMGHASISTTMKYADFHPEYRDVAPYMEAVDELYRERPKLRAVAGGGA